MKPEVKQLYIKTKGIVLREVKYRDNDKLLTVLTEDLGKITVLSFGSRSVKGKNAATSQVFAYSELTIVKKGERFTLETSDPIEIFYALRGDIKKLALAQYFVQLTDFVTYEGEEKTQILYLLCNCLFALCRTGKDLKQIKAAFELKALCHSGYAPQTGVCFSCGSCEKLYFSFGAGTSFCANCSKDKEDLTPLNASVINAMNFIKDSAEPKLLSFLLSEENLLLLSTISERYVLTVLEKKFSALEFYNNLT